VPNKDVANERGNHGIVPHRRERRIELNRRWINLVFAGVIAAGPALAGVVVKGSDTVLPLSQKEAEVYLQKDKAASVAIIGGGSGVGLAALIDGTCDIAQSSRPIKSKETRQAKQKGVNPVETIVAKDALTVIVHPSNPVKKLTVQQIGDIFTGVITNWKDVGGPQKSIVVYSRESSSGTYAFFREHVLANKEYTSAALLAPATGAIVQSVSQTEGAIGYVGMAYLTPSVTALEVAAEAGKPYVPASTANALDGSYPIARELFYYTNGQPKGEAKAFIDFILSPEGQKLVEDVGYVPVKPGARS
jgi:phosphate transport system substrate-binding protein